MAFLRRNDNAKPDYTALQVQTSTSILPIPIVWGQNKVSPNLIWYANFRAAPGGGGKGIGGKGGAFGSSAAASADYTYYSDLIMALCEGPLSSLGPYANGIGWIWKDLSVYLQFELGLGSAPGETPQPVWSYLEETTPWNALAYQGTAYLWGAGYNLGDSASIGNHNVEVYGPLAGTGVNGIDADPALVIQDFLINAQYGVGFNPASIDSGSLFTNPDSFQNYCRAMGFAFSPALVSQEQASSILARWLQLFNCAAVWSGGLLKFIPYGDTAISQGSASTQSTQLSVPIPIQASSGATIPAFVAVASQGAFVSDGGVVYAFSNFPFTFIGAAIPTVAGQYGMVVPGTYIFAVPDEGKPIVITYTAQTVGGYTPDLTPVYELTDSDFIDEKGNKDPVQVERVDVFSLPTIQRVEVLSRGNEYSALPVEARDQSQIEIFGPRVGSTIQGHEICDEFVIGPLVAQTILQRELYVRTKFTFKLSWEYCLLDPMDIVSLTDTNLGLSNYLVRIIQIEEDDKGLLSFTCEELVAGVSNPALNPSASSTGFQPNWGVPAVPVNTPLIYQPPAALTGGVEQIWLGTSGINAGGGQIGNTQGAQWGGASVYASVDDVTYAQIGVITAPLRQGFLTSSLAAAGGWDPVNTLAVSLAESVQPGTAALNGTSQAAAQAGATLSLVDQELLAYEVAALSGGTAYNLTGLARGLSGSSPTFHSSGAPFARLDGAVLRFDVPANFRGQTVWFKFQSFNILGGGTQDLSTCIGYQFNITAPPTAHPITTQLDSGFPLDLGQVISAPTVSDDFGHVASDPVVDTIDLGAVAVTVTHPIAVQLLTGTPLDLGLTKQAVTVSDDFGSTNDAVVDVINLGTVP
ncbi:MAG: phage tail protein [Roseiarcus sp.]